MNKPIVLAVSSSSSHTFSKHIQPSIKLIAGIGVEGDAHAGKTVKHRYLVKIDSTKPNIRQVHLIQTELFDELKEKGFKISSGELGENITTKGVNLLELPKGTKLEIGDEVVVELTALRNPCIQIDNFQKGLLKEVLQQDENGNLIRKGGVMGVVLSGGEIFPGDSIKVVLPEKPFQQLEYIW